MKKKVYNFIDNEEKYAPLIAKEIVEAFKSEANEENVEYSFTLDGETKEIKEKNANTYFVFDTVGETYLDEFKKLLFNEDLSEIKEESIEEKVLMEDVRKFLFKVCQKITNEYKDDIRETIRRVVLGNKYQEERVPLSNIEVISIDVADFSSVTESYKYILIIVKVPGSENNTA